MFELLKKSIDLQQHVAKYTQLRQSGRLMQGLCPLHDDRESPSLYIYPDGHWWCFAEQKGGDVIDFEAARQSLSMGDAAKWLCDQYNLHPTFKDRLVYQQTLALRKTKESWLEGLDGSFKVRPDLHAYVRDRGLSDQTIADFQLGAGESTNVIVIPVHDRFGKIAGFARRNLDPDAKEKYLNDSSDAIYNKSEILFNFHRAKAHIKSSKAVVINEGYFDVMSLWEASVKHSVAVCGSRIGKEQAKLLSDVVDENTIFYLVPTNDPTAQEFLEKNILQLQAHFPKNHIRCLTIPEGCKDLNDVLKASAPPRLRGPEDVPVMQPSVSVSVKDVYDQSVPAEIYLLKRILKNEPVIEMQYNKVKNLCATITSTMILEDMVDVLVKAWGKARESVRAFVFSKVKDDSIPDDKFKRMSDLIREYDTYVETLEENRIKFGWSKLDKFTRGMRMGDVTVFVAASGVGKTVWAENLICNAVKNYPKLPVMFASLEQTGVMAFERFVQMEGSLESSQVEQWMKAKDQEVSVKINATIQRMSQSFDNFILVEEGKMGLTQLENYIVQAGLRKFNSPVKLVVIDYLGYLQGEGKDLYHKVSDIAREVKELAKRQKCHIVLLCQVSKVGKSGGSPLEGYQARDSGVIQESADVLISAWRPELKENLSDEKKKEFEGVYMIQLAKNRYGENGKKIEFIFVKKWLQLLEKRDEINLSDGHTIK